MRVTLATQLAAAVPAAQELRKDVTEDNFLKWCDQYPAQIVVLATQVNKTYFYW